MITVPNDTGGVSAGRGVGAPVDTYVRPAVPTEDNSLNQLTNSLSKLGVDFTDIAAEKAAKQEKEALAQVEYKKSQIYQSIKEGEPYAAQIGRLLPEDSAAVRARVEESWGADKGEEEARAHVESILQDQQLRLNPGAMEAKLAELRAQAAERVKGNPSFGAGYVKAYESNLDRFRTAAQGERATVYDAEQKKAYTREVLQNSDAAHKTWTPMDKDTATGIAKGAVDPIGAVVNKIIGVESGGSASIKNPRSSAGGLGQFTKGTWINTVRQFGPAEYKSLPDEVLAPMRMDPKYADLQKDMTYAFTKMNATSLEKLGLGVAPANIYLMHFAGEGDAPKILKAADGTKVTDVMDPASIKANPFLKNWTVGELKEWSAKKMGDSFKGTWAAQNAIRQTDRNWSNTSSLGNVVRRDAIASGLADMAVKSADETILDRMPPELITPEIAANFAAIKRQVKEIKTVEANHIRAEEDRVKKAKTEANIAEINDGFVNGVKPDLRKYTHDKEAFEYAKKVYDDDLLDKGASLSNANEFERATEVAARTNDWSAVTGKKEMPTMQELEKALRDKPDITLADKRATMNKLDNVIKAASAVNSPETKSWFDNKLKTYVESFKDQPGLREILALKGINPEGIARSHFEFEVQSLMKAYLTDPANKGQMPVGMAERSVYQEAVKNTMEYVQKIVDTKDVPKDAYTEGSDRPEMERIPVPGMPKMFELRPKAKPGTTPAAAPAPVVEPAKAAIEAGSKPYPLADPLADHPTSEAKPVEPKPIVSAKLTDDGGIHIQMPPDVTRHIQATIGQIIGADGGQSLMDSYPRLRSLVSGHAVDKQQKIDAVQGLIQQDEEWQFLNRRANRLDGNAKSDAQRELKEYEDIMADQLIKALNKSAM